MKQSWDAISLYRDSYRPWNQEAPQEDDFEEIVARKMSSPAEIPVRTSNSRVEIDPYELIVQRKMEEKPPAPIPIPSPDKPPRVRRRVSFETDKESASGGESESASQEEEDTALLKRAPRKLFKRKQKKSPHSTAVPQKSESDFVTPKRSRKPQMRGPVPRFFRHPDHASEEEKRHLYGPFYVVWPKNKDMPSSYAELARIYGRRH
jgi:hypothetical protein